MLLTITTTHQPATDLGYLLHKHPERRRRSRWRSGTAHVFYPEASDERCTAALLLDVDPVGLVAARRAQPVALDQYVNDRPVRRLVVHERGDRPVFGTALAGRCNARPSSRDAAAARGAPAGAALPRGRGALRRLFEPLGYAVEPSARLDDVPEWGRAATSSSTLEGDVRLADLLAHLYVLIPVLDDEKHYWVGEPRSRSCCAAARAGWPTTPSGS